MRPIKPRRRALPALACAGLLSACASATPPPVPPKVVTLRPEIPTELRRCPPAPVPPASEGLTQDAFAIYAIDLAESRDACAARLETVIELLAPPPIAPAGFGGGE